MSDDAFDVGKVGNVVEGLRGEDSRYTDCLQPRSGPHSELRYGIVELPGQGLEISGIWRNQVQLFGVVKRKVGDMLWIFRASETNSDLFEIRRVEEGYVLERDVICVPVQGAEVGQEDVVGSELTEGRPSREGEVTWPSPLNLEISYNSGISVDTGPFVWFRSAFKVLDASGISLQINVRGRPLT